MNRRRFLQVLGLGGGALAATPVTAAPTKLWKKWFPYGWKYRHFDPTQQYGDYFRMPKCAEVHAEAGNRTMAEMTQLLDVQIAETVPPELRDHVQYAFINPDPHASDPMDCVFGYASWKYCPGGNPNPKILIHEPVRVAILNKNWICKLEVEA